MVSLITTDLLKFHNYLDATNLPTKEILCPFIYTKFVSDLRQVGGFLRVLRSHPPIKLTAII